MQRHASAGTDPHALGVCTPLACSLQYHMKQSDRCRPCILSQQVTLPSAAGAVGWRGAFAVKHSPPHGRTLNYAAT